MPLRSDIKKVLVIGSGPIIIGQAAEFDYAGTQACRALKQEGLEVVLINSNPATIMTDKAMADKVYIEPLTLDVVKRIIQIEKPDSLLSTMGGQTGLTLSMQLAEEGFLDAVLYETCEAIHLGFLHREMLLDALLANTITVLHKALHIVSTLLAIILREVESRRIGTIYHPYRAYSLCTTKRKVGCVGLLVYINLEVVGKVGYIRQLTVGARELLCRTCAEHQSTQKSISHISKYLFHIAEILKLIFY